MKRHLLLPGVALALTVVFVAGCDFLGMGPSADGGGPVALLRYQNFSHFEEERIVDVGDTTLPTSIVSRVNLLADQDTVAKSVGLGQSTGDLDFPVGGPVTVEARSIPGDDLLASAEISLEQDSSYALYTFGYAPDITPVLLQRAQLPEAGEDEVPPLEGEATFRFLQAAPTTGPVDIYINRPAEADSLEPAVTELEPVYSDVAYLDYTGTTSYDVSRVPDSEIGNTLHVRMTPAADTTLIYDQNHGFNPESMQHILIYDYDRNAEDDVLDIRLGRKSGDATMIDI